MGIRRNITTRAGLAGFGAGLFLLLSPSAALAETYRVGPGEAYATIQDTLGLIAPGDVVEVMGDHTYPGDVWFEPEHSGTEGAPVTVRGIAVNGKRPVLQGVGTEQWHDMIVLLYANHFVFEGFEIVGDGNPDHTGIIHKADDVTVRDVIVHDVGSHGLLGTDSESGSLTLEACEFYNNGNGLYDHQIYMATDESAYPGSVFRMQYCYVHDGAGGNNVKSRAERNEIYYNWIEGAVYHELDLIGPDGQDANLAREDSDVVGNVLIKTSEWRIARIGGDGTGNTSGRYRFVNNTMVLGAASDIAIGLQQTVESLELHNNVILRVGANGGRLWNHSEPEGPDPTMSGSNNWIQDGFTDIPSSYTGTLRGSDAGFTDLAGFDFRLADGSPLIDQGTSDTTAAPALPNPLMLPAFVPPSRALGTHAARPSDATPDIGAYEWGTGSEPGTGGSGGGSSGTGGSGTGGSGTGGGASGTGGSAAPASSSDEGDGCACRAATGSDHQRSPGGTLIGVALALWALRRKRS